MGGTSSKQSYKLIKNNTPLEGLKNHEISEKVYSAYGKIRGLKNNIERLKVPKMFTTRKRRMEQIERKEQEIKSIENNVETLKRTSHNRKKAKVLANGFTADYDKHEIGKFYKQFSRGSYEPIYTGKLVGKEIIPATATEPELYEYIFNYKGFGPSKYRHHEIPILKEVPEELLNRTYREGEGWGGGKRKTLKNSRK